MAYNETYSATDAPVVVIDLVVTVLAILVTFGGLIGLGMLYKHFKKTAPRF